jgi:hypothetical protein
LDGLSLDPPNLRKLSAYKKKLQGRKLVANAIRQSIHEKYQVFIDNLLDGLSLDPPNLVRSVLSVERVPYLILDHIDPRLGAVALNDQNHCGAVRRLGSM